MLRFHLNFRQRIGFLRGGKFREMDTGSFEMESHGWGPAAYAGCAQGGRFSPLYIGYSMHCISKPGMDSCRPSLLVSLAVARLYGTSQLGLVPSSTGVSWHCSVGVTCVRNAGFLHMCTPELYKPWGLWTLRVQFKCLQ